MAVSLKMTFVIHAVRFYKENKAVVLFISLEVFNMWTIHKHLSLIRKFNFTFLVQAGDDDDYQKNGNEESNYNASNPSSRSFLCGTKPHETKLTQSNFIK